MTPDRSKQQVQPIPKGEPKAKTPRKRLRARSKEMAATYRRERIPLVVRLLEERPWCELRTPVCTGRAVCLHEVVKRSAGGSITDPTNCMTTCERCNGWVEDNPGLARALGLSLRAGVRNGAA